MVADVVFKFDFFMQAHTPLPVAVFRASRPGWGL
jgi:hypothetical protein